MSLLNWALFWPISQRGSQAQELALQEVIGEGFELAANDGTVFDSNLTDTEELWETVRDRWKIILITQLSQRHPAEISAN